MQMTRSRIWRKQYESMDPTCLSTTFQAGDGIVVIYGILSWQYLDPLIRVYVYNVWIGMFFILFFAVCSVSWWIFPVPRCIYLSLDLKLLIVFSVILRFYIRYLLLLMAFRGVVSFNYKWLNNFWWLIWFIPIIRTRKVSDVLMGCVSHISFFLIIVDCNIMVLRA